MRSRDLGLLLLSSGALAQTFTDCDPTKEDCPDDKGLTDYHYSVDFTQGEHADWIMTYNEATYDENGVGFAITGSGMAPTMQSDFYMFFGSISAIVRAAPGAGIVSCVILESDCLDEVDWEWLGGDTTQVQTNYFGKGNTTTYDRGTYEAAPDNQNTARNYTLVWTAESTRWLIDDVEVRVLNYADAVGGANYPQTPMRIKLGNWIAADTNNQGTIDWAGGVPDYAQSPFTMYIERIDIVNYNPAVTYSYGDRSGSWESIVMSNDTATSENVADSPKENSPITEESSLTDDGDNLANGTSSSASVTPSTSTVEVSKTTGVNPTGTGGSTPAEPIGDSGATTMGPAAGAVVAALAFVAFLF